MKLGRTTKIRQNFFLSSFAFLFFPNNKNSAEFFCAFGSFNHSRYQCFLSLWFNPSQLSLSSSVSAFVSILADRSSTAQPVLQVSLYSFLRIARPLRLPPIHPSTSFVASTSFLDCSGFLWPSLPSRLGFLAASPIAGSIRGLFICLGVTSPWVGSPSKTSHYIVPWYIS